MNQTSQLQKWGAYHREHRVVVVDDDYDTRTILTRVLYDAGFGVIPAQDGWEAVEAMRNADLAPHALVTDLWMPRLSGDQLLGTAHAFHPEVGRVLYTGDRSSDAYYTCLDVTADAVLAKPFPDPQALVDAIQQAIDAGARRRGRRRYR